jgi:hypothetical protein
MRWIKIKQILMRQISPEQIQVMHVQKYFVAEQVCSVSPAVIPTEVAGPDGKPQPKEGTEIGLVNGEKILVEGAMEEILWLIKNEEFEISEPDWIEDSRSIIEKS